MLSHVLIGSNDIEKSSAFYDGVLGILGYERRSKGDSWAGYGDIGGPGIDTFWLSKPLDGDLASVGNGTNVAFLATSRKLVDEFYQRALALGGTDEGAPGIREDAHPNFYAAYIRDLEGNKILAVCHEPE